MAAEAAPASENKYEETELILGAVVQLFSDRSDIRTVQESAQVVADLKKSWEQRNRENLQSIRGAHAPPRRTGRHAHARAPGSLLAARAPLHSRHACSTQARPPAWCLWTCAELTGQTERAKQKLDERETALLNPAPRNELLTERNRVEENITTLRKARPTLGHNCNRRWRAPSNSLHPPPTPPSQEMDALKAHAIAEEGRSSELSAREQLLWQQENVEVPRARHAISLYANISSIRWDFSSVKVKGFITSAVGSGIKSFELEPTQQSEFAVVNSLWDLMDV